MNKTPNQIKQDLAQYYINFIGTYDLSYKDVSKMTGLDPSLFPKIAKNELDDLSIHGMMIGLSGIGARLKVKFSDSNEWNVPANLTQEDAKKLIEKIQASICSCLTKYIETTALAPEQYTYLNKNGGNTIYNLRSKKSRFKALLGICGALGKTLSVEVCELPTIETPAPEITFWFELVGKDEKFNTLNELRAYLKEKQITSSSLLVDVILPTYKKTHRYIGMFKPTNYIFRPLSPTSPTHISFWEAPFYIGIETKGVIRYTACSNLRDLAIELQDLDVGENDKAYVVERGRRLNKVEIARIGDTNSFVLAPVNRRTKVKINE